MRSGIDEMTFSLDGASQDVYVRYRQRGSFEKSTAMMRAAIDEKRRLGRDVPVINWRYILFNWNDNDREMERARRLAAECGVDRLCWEITDHPEHAYSRRFAPGTEDRAAIRHEIWDDNNLGNAIPGAMPRARIEVRGAPPDASLYATPGATLRSPRASATCRSGPSPPPRPTAAATCASARSWRPPTARRSTATGRAPSCRTRSAGGSRADVAIDVPRRASPAATPCASTWSAKASTGSRRAAPRPPSAS